VAAVVSKVALCNDEVAPLSLLLRGRPLARLFWSRITIQQVFQFLAGLEVGSTFGRNFYAGARFRITTDSRLPLASTKASKTPDLDLIASVQGPYHATENRIDNVLRIFPRHLHGATEFLDQSSFGHHSNLYSCAKSKVALTMQHGPAAENI
jgi:hypothetical protein